MTLLLALLVAHCLCDYPLQGDFLARAKNHSAPIAGVPWWCAMAAHAAIHGGAVGWLTASAVWGLLEFAAHFWIDWLKCRGRINFLTDQMLHVACKVVCAAAIWVARGGAS